MSCDHKFINDLNLGNLPFKPVTLIVGTFNPSWPKNNGARWFYGRTSNNYFWDVLPRLYGEPNLRKSEPAVWKRFCITHRIAITDLIRTIYDADPTNSEHQKLLGNYADSNIVGKFFKFSFTSITSILDKHPTIGNIYLTRQAGIPLFDKLWVPVQQYCLDRNLKAPMLLTPSGSARFQIGPYKLAHPGAPEPLRNFIFESWLEHWHNKFQYLTNYNESNTHHGE